MAIFNQKKRLESIIISHPGTDFDSLASMWSAHLLERDSDVVMIAGQDSNVREFLSLYGSEFPRYKLKDIDIGAVKKLTVVDCSSRSQLGRIDGLLDRQSVYVEVWDHHREEGPDFKVDKHHFQNVGSNTTILVNEIKKRRLSVSNIEATLLMLGIYEDTGSLKFPSTSPDDLEMAAWLLKSGASLDVVDRFLGIRLNPSQKKLLSDLGHNVQATEIRGIPVHYTFAMADEFVDEIAFLARKVQETESADVIFALVEMKDRVFIVGRSRLPSVDIGRILGVFGGGGHAQAASCLLTGVTHQVALQKLLDIIKEQVSPTTVAREIMSTPVKIIDPNALIREAGMILARSGISGLVVVDRENHVIGVITRRDVDKALGHNLGHAPVKGYMARDPVTANEELSLDEVQKLVINHRAGFIPVISDGKLSGIITRSDIIRALHSKSVSSDLSGGEDMISSEQEKGRELLGKMPVSYSALLGIACETADALNVACYLVGGIVRDLVIDRPNVDIDLLIEGDGLRFAHEMASSLNAKVLENKRFRTAKIILQDGFHIDIATAREEFYIQPGALPEVAAAGIRDDLSRRDFTINTLAISLNSRNWGTLIDHFGALADIKARLIRVLHTFSFVDDPTRILRALRFSTRFDFELEALTSDLLRRALLEGRLDDISPERIRDEFLLCLNEEKPWSILRRICEEGVLGILNPALVLPLCMASESDPLAESYEWVSRSLYPEEMPRKDLTYLALALSESDPAEALKFVHHYRFDNTVTRMIEGLSDYKKALKKINNEKMTASVLTGLMESIPEPWWVLVAMHTPQVSGAREKIRQFFSKFHKLKPRISGEDLIKEGFEPGRAFSDALNAVRSARLDGYIQSREEELSLAKKILRGDSA